MFNAHKYQSSNSSVIMATAIASTATINAATQVIRSIDEFSMFLYTHAPDKRATMSEYLRNAIAIEGETTSASVYQVIGDGNCFFHSIRAFMQSSASLENPPEASALAEMTAAQVREFDPDYTLDSNSPEYELLCCAIASLFGINICVLSYDPYRRNGIPHTKVYGGFYDGPNAGNDTAFLYNSQGHFYLVVPTSPRKTNAETRSAILRRQLAASDAF